MAGKAVAGKNSKSKSGCSCRKNGSSSREELVAGRTVAVAVAGDIVAQLQFV